MATKRLTQSLLHEAHLEDAFLIVIPGLSSGVPGKIKSPKINNPRIIAKLPIAQDR